MIYSVLQADFANLPETLHLEDIWPVHLLFGKCSSLTSMQQSELYKAFLDSYMGIPL